MGVKREKYHANGGRFRPWTARYNEPMDTPSPRHVAQRLYDQSEINFLDDDRKQLNSWADCPGALDALVAEDGVDFKNIGPGRGKALWTLVSERRPDLLVPLLSKAANQGMIPPVNLAVPDTLLDDNVRGALVEWLVKGPDPDPTLGARLFKQCAMDFVVEGSAKREAVMCDMARTIDFSRIEEMALWWIKSHCLRDASRVEELSNSKKSFEMLISNKLDLRSEIIEPRKVGGVHQDRSTPLKHRNILEMVAYYYAKNGFERGELILALIERGADWQKTIEDKDTPPLVREGLVRHPWVRKELLGEMATAEDRRNKATPKI